MKPSLGIIGGSGLYEARLIESQDVIEVPTPYGKPSASVEVGVFREVAVAFLARHGRRHEIPPHGVNHKANIWALREVGVERLVTTSSVGSLKLDIRPGEFVVPDDYLSPWKIPTYHDEAVVHVTPELDPILRKELLKAARSAGVRARDGGVYVQTTGPRLETRAEIRMLQQFGDVVGMTMASEATLARELDIPYACVCTVDNYCHGLTEEPLTYDEIVRVQREKTEDLRRVVQAFLEAVS